MPAINYPGRLPRDPLYDPDLNSLLSKSKPGEAVHSRGYTGAWQKSKPGEASAGTDPPVTTTGRKTKEVKTTADEFGRPLKKHEWEARQRDKFQAQDIADMQWLLKVIEGAGSKGVEAPELLRAALLDRDSKPDHTRKLLGDLAQGSYRTHDADSPILEVKSVSLRYVSRDHP